MCVRARSHAQLEVELTFLSSNHIHTHTRTHKHTRTNTQVKVESKPWTIQLPTRKLEVELTTLSSNYHLEMNPSDVGYNDRYVVQEIIKEMARSKPVDATGGYEQLCSLF